MEPSNVLRIFLFFYLLCGGVYSLHLNESKTEANTFSSNSFFKTVQQSVWNLVRNHVAGYREEKGYHVIEIFPLESNKSYSKEVPFDLLPPKAEEDDITFLPEVNVSSETSKSKEITIELKTEESETGTIINETNEKTTEEPNEELTTEEGNETGGSGSGFSIIPGDDEDYSDTDGSGSGDKEVSPESSEEFDQLINVMCTHTDFESFPWWRVDLRGTYTVQKVVIFNRSDRLHTRLHDISIRIGMKDIACYRPRTFHKSPLNEECMLREGILPPGENVIECHQPIEGRYVTIQIMTDIGRIRSYIGRLTLCEVEVYANDNGVVKNVALKKPSQQSTVKFEGIPRRAVDGVVSAQYYAATSQMSCLQGEIYKNEDGFDTSLMNPLPADCAEIYLQGKKKTGIYTIYPKGWLKTKPIQVFCDMDKDGGGWTSILRRHYYIDHVESFHRFLKDYIDGFGELCEEFWLGLNNLHVLTTQNSVQLRVLIHNSYGKDIYAHYEKFLVLDSEHNYKSYVFGYNGTAGDYFKSGVEFKMRNKEGGWWWHTYDEGPHSFLGMNPNGDLWHGRNVSDPVTWGCQECHKSEENYYIQYLHIIIRPSWYEDFIRLRDEKKIMV